MNTTQIFASNRRKALAGAGVVAAGATLLATSLLGGNPTSTGTERRTSTAADSAPTSWGPDRQHVGAPARIQDASSLRGRHVARPGLDVLPGLAVAPRWTDPRSNPVRDDEPATARQTPQKVTLVLPEYHRGTVPTVAPPSVSGSPPSAHVDDGSVTITIPRDGAVTPPTVTPGESGRLEPPAVIVE